MGLRSLFGPSKKEIWRQLSAELGAEFVEGGFWKADKVQATYGEWTVTLDTYVVSTGKSAMVFTRMRAPYVNPEGFRFTIYRKNLFSGMAKLLGMQDIAIGDPAFDDAFIVKSSDEARVTRLLANPRIRQLIDAQKDIKFSVRDDEGCFGPTFPEGVDELNFAVLGVIKDIERLKQLYALFSETLEELCRMGSAYRTEPGVDV